MALAIGDIEEKVIGAPAKVVKLFPELNARPKPLTISDRRDGGYYTTLDIEAAVAYALQTGNIQEAFQDLFDSTSLIDSKSYK